MKNVALITGASSGIGADLARIHAENGNDIIAIATSTERLDALKQELEGHHGVKVLTIAKDLTQDTSAKEIYDQITGDGIEIDYLINNAGFGGQGKFHERG